VDPEKRRHYRRFEADRRRAITPHAHHVQSARSTQTPEYTERRSAEAYNRPTLDDWEPEYPCVRPACFTSEPCTALMGLDELRVLRARTQGKYA
jgi:hypothetical protein